MVLGNGNRRPPGKRRPIEKRYIGLFHIAYGRFGILAERWAESGMLCIEPLQAVIAGPQVKLSCARPECVGLLEVSILDFFRRFLHVHVRVLCEAAGSCE